MHYIAVMENDSFTKGFAERVIVKEPPAHVKAGIARVRASVRAHIQDGGTIESWVKQRSGSRGTRKHI